ncbi:MAG: 30S ribosome-binding factor RbfA [Clostridium argentinense]|uniref:Ribosome-binding factor A n=1 Tax=Clostridium faecium TaxID=2762223 RepID=A0ABR8YVD1_9CLOT|nr:MULTISPECIES: 30S ribosome-binding factor RbfA [Clostridium]MBD8048102.1 30S ribosome-binding factor RbfA [Clostridium faecium]MBS5823743.1 30S ribosome-binding factor RbfA [Clostridium argentinense]MDU1348165.1 30S ribosome-binding factor RbfA [Clostridium argentinense]
MAKYRSGRINEEIKRDVSNTIQNKIKDPRLTAMISVTDVDVSKDLSYAKIYVSIFGNEKEKKDSYLALKNSAGFIRKEIAKNVKIRHIPEVIIELDETLDKAQHLDSLLEQIKEQNSNDNK